MSQMGFRRFLVNSILDVQAVAAMYVEYEDMDIVVGETFIAASYDSDATRPDKGDIHIRRGGDWKIVEVKGTHRSFEEMNTWDNLIICQKKGYDAKDFDADWYFFVAGCRTKGLYHDHRKHKDKMTITRYEDTASGESKETYVLAREYWKPIDLGGKS